MRALERGLWGVPGAPPRVLDLDTTVFLAFMEGLVREQGEDESKRLDRLYAAARPRRTAPRTAASRDERRREIARFAGLTGGDF